MTAATGDLAALYEDLDACLVRREAYYPRREEPDWSLLQEKLAEVTKRLWAAASAEQARRPPDHLGSLAERPVFVLGYYKSGTSLLLNLLDGHPDLLSLPGESRHFTSLGDDGPSSEETLRRLHAHWIRNTITPYGLPPRWLLGRPEKDDDDPYDRFGRALMAFARARSGSDVLAAVAQALATVTDASPRYWVEKTPMHELRVRQILTAYPEARFVHIVRDPHSTIGSIAGYGSETPIVDVLSGAAELSRSFRAALDWPQRLGGRYIVIQYEALVTDTKRTMHKVAESLDIPYDDSMLVPTTLGMPATANAGRRESRVSGAVHTHSLERGSRLGRIDRLVIEALAGRPAQELGYVSRDGNSGVALAARIVLFARYRMRKP